MNQPQKTRHIQPLFFRILASISVPIAVLLVAFVSLVIRREFQMQEHFYRQEGEIHMDTAYREYAPALAEEAASEDPKNLKEKTEELTRRIGAEQIDIVDPVLRFSVLASVSPLLTNQKTWATSKIHLRGIEKSLSLYANKVPYYLKVDSQMNKLYGYLPFNVPKKDRTFVAVAELPLLSLRKSVRSTLKILTILCLIGLSIAFVISYGLTKRIIRPLNAINRALREILLGKLGQQVEVRTGDELELLAVNFNRMSQALLIVTRRAENSNPLTQLPGNREIASEISRRIAEGKKFVYFHADLDHFKAYNDQYGLARGDEVIQRTANILVETVRELGHPENFVGHQGGDDFVLIVEPSQADQAGKAVCQKFDACMKDFYTQEDLQRGYFLAEDARASTLTGEKEIKRQSLMGISLAGVSNVRKDYASYEQVLECAVVMKKEAKKLPYSVHVIDE